MNMRYDAPTAPPGVELDIRERLEERGAVSVADFELVAAILGTGSRGKDVRVLSSEILDRCDFSAGVPAVDALAAVRGLGRARACRLAAALELGKRYFGYRELRVSGPEDAWHLVRHFADRKQERFIIASLNGAHDVIAVRVVTVGLANRTIVHPREIFAEAVSDRACAVIAAHNHPSGRLDPSPEDLEITARLRDAGELLGIPLLDHVVFSQDGYLSLAEAGLMPDPAR